MANTGWFSAGSSPSTEMYCEAHATRNGSTVTVNCTVKSRHVYSSGFMGTGYEIKVYAKSNLGGQGEVVHHSTSDSWSGTAEHTSTFSFTFNDTSNTSCTVTFWSSTNTSSAYKFSDKSTTASFSSYTPTVVDNTIFIGINSGAYMEIMDRMAYRYPTWSQTGDQDDIVWCTLGGGSWTRAGLNFSYGHGHTHQNASLDDLWITHVYQGNSNDGVGTFAWYPRIYIKYNANGGSSTPSTQTKYIGSQLTLASAISRTNYDFQGWSTSSTATSAEYSAGLTLDYEAWNSHSAPLASNSGWLDFFPAIHDGNSVTLYAVWKGKTYEVAYNANGGSSTPTSQSVVYPNSCTLASAISRNNGTSTSTGTITISYNVNGGNSTAPTASTGTYTDTTTTKYTFEKWHLNSTSGTAYAAGASYSPSSDVTMYAGWTSTTSTARTTNPSITLTNTKPTKSNSTVSSYKVSYNANSGSSTPTAQTATKTRSYTFSKWNSKSDGSGTDYNANTAYTFNANATLYAKYTSSDSGGGVTLASAISRANGSTTGYSVTYNANNGTGAPSAQTSGNRTITYTFNKWAAGSTSGTQYAAGASYSPTADTTMYATWNSSTSSNSSWTCSSTKPTRSGYKFLGWSTSSTATTATYTAGSTYTITGALTLYAVWEQLYTVTYNYSENGGTSATKTTDSLAHNASVDLTPTATKSGWTFVGWNTSSTATTKLTSLKINKANVTLYAIFSKTITATCYYYNNQSTTVSGTMYNKSTSKSLTLPTIADQTINNVKYTGRHWSTGTTGNDSTNSVNAGASATLSSNTTYYASYKSDITATFYYCTSKSDEFIVTNLPQSSATSTRTRYMNYKGTFVDFEFTVPTAVTSSSAGTSAPTYKGVSTAKNSTTTTTPTNANTTFYAVYSETCTSYYYNGTTHTSKAITRRALSNGTNYVLSLSENPPTPSAYDGASFIRWSYESNQYGESYGREHISTGSDNLYAVYQKGLTLTYNANGGSGAPAASTGTKYYVSKNGGINSYNPTITLNTTKPTKTGYTFNGWYDATSGGNKIGTTYSISANKTIYAQYTENTYTIAFNPNGGTGSMASLTGVKYTESKTLTKNTFTRIGHTFLGWSTNSAATTATYEDEASVSKLVASGTVTLYAIWQINKYYIDVNGSLDGTEQANTSPMGTFEVYINGAQAQGAATDYYVQKNYGTTYEIKNIKANDGYIYTGPTSDSDPLSGTVTRAMKIRLGFKTKPDQAEIRYKDNGTWKKALVSKKVDGAYKNVITIYKKVDGVWKQQAL